MRATEIVYPLEAGMPQNKIKQHKDTWKSIKKQLKDLKEGQCITFEELFLKLKVNENDYRLAVRSSVNAPTVFLKRNPSELRINNYNPACLEAWRANMDIQFVLDVYACAMYIVSYISKAQKGMSELLRQACTEARKGNSSIKQQVRDIGNKLISNIIRKIQLRDRNRPSGIIWVQFDHTDVGEKIRHDNRRLHVEGIECTWTPILLPVTAQFAAGKNRTAQVVRKQFPLRPAAAKTIHRSQGDTETNIVVNFNTQEEPYLTYIM